MAVRTQRTIVAIVGNRARRLTALGLWVLAAGTAIVLGVRRYRAALAEPQPDLESFFLPAARAVRNGIDPYDVVGYFYPPPVALILAPVADAPNAPEFWTALRLIAGVAACVLAALACTPRGDGIRSGVVAVIALVTLLWSVPTSLDLWAGQVQLLVLLALCGAALAEVRERRFLAGLALGAGALLKAWPAMFGLWLLRRGARHRGRQWLGVAAAAAIAVVTALLVAGPAGVVSMIASPLSGGDQPVLTANSVWGLPRLLFSDTPMASPLIESPMLRIAATIVLLVWIAGLGIIALVRPGEAFVSLFNIAFVVILLLPVSHYFYVIYALPTLWWWVSRVLSGERSAVTWIALCTSAAWWIVVFRIPPAGDGFMTTTWPSQLLIFSASAVAATVSVLAAAAAPEARRPSARDELLGRAR
jgi:uncharacterized membrane protein